MSDPRLIASLGFISAISRSVLAIATLGFIDETEPEPEPQPSQGRYHGPPNPPRREPTMSPTMAACMLLCGAQLSGLGYGELPQPDAAK